MRYFLEFSYLGTNFHGWQRQPNAYTVQEELEKAFSVILNEEISIQGSSRTDTGVHAKHQFAHFDSSFEIENLEHLVYKVNRFISKEIALQKLYRTTPVQHSRFDALYRLYMYSFSKEKSPFNFQTTLFFQSELNFENMNKASNFLLQYTDFQCFSKVKTEVNNFDCTIYEAFWCNENEVFSFHIKANRFLRGMVRAIVGTLLEVGMGKISIEQFEEIILSKDRSKAGKNVPAHGLTLIEVAYPENYFL